MLRCYVEMGWVGSGSPKGGVLCAPRTSLSRVEFYSAAQCAQRASLCLQEAWEALGPGLILHLCLVDFMGS